MQLHPQIILNLCMNILGGIKMSKHKTYCQPNLAEYRKASFFCLVNRLIVLKSCVRSLSYEQMHKNSFPFFSWIKAN